MIIVSILVIALATAVTIAEAIHLRKLETQLASMMHDIEMLVENNNRLDK